MTDQRKINDACFFICNLSIALALYLHTTQTEHAMTDKALDLLEFIAGAAISAGFIFLSAYALVGGI
jgi:hypothetical protein